MARSTFVKTLGVSVTAVALKALPINLSRSYLAIFNPAAADLLVALGGDVAPAADDYFVLAPDQNFEFGFAVASAVWLKGTGAQVAVVAEAK